MNKTLEDVIKEIKKDIFEKDELNLRSIDFDVMAWISVYEHGAESYKEEAKNWIITFYCKRWLHKQKVYHERI